MRGGFEKRYADICAALEQAARKGRHPYHLMFAACVNEQNEPEVRTVVLRGFDESARDILFHTDIRSPKASWLKANPAISLLFYDRDSKCQLRFKGKAAVHYEDALCERQWEKTHNNSKLCYLAPQGSGHAVDAPNDCGMDGRRGPVEAPAEDAEAYSNFAVIRTVYQSLDVVWLDYKGHERMQLWWNKDGSMQGQWVTI